MRLLKLSRRVVYLVVLNDWHTSAQCLTLAFPPTVPTLFTDSSLIHPAYQRRLLIVLAIVVLLLLHRVAGGDPLLGVRACLLAFSCASPLWEARAHHVVVVCYAPLSTFHSDVPLQSRSGPDCTRVKSETRYWA